MLTWSVRKIRPELLAEGTLGAAIGYEDKKYKVEARGESSEEVSFYLRMT
jgi:hypothetical protein